MVMLRGAGAGGRAAAAAASASQPSSSSSPSSSRHQAEGEVTLWYPLHAAVRSGSATIVELLLQASAEVDVCGGVERRTPLHFAAAMADDVVARMLLNAGADVEKFDANGQHPAALIPPVKHRAVAVGGGGGSGAGEGAGVARGCREYSLHRALSQCVQLCAAAEAGDTEVVKAMLGTKKQQAAGTAAPANALGMRSRAALHHAVATGNADVVAALLKSSANPNVQAGLCSQDFAESLTGQPPVLGM